jgi:hypothetical protein
MSLKRKLKKSFKRAVRENRITEAEYNFIKQIFKK